MFKLALIEIPTADRTRTLAPNYASALEETIQECIAQGLDERILVCIASCSKMELLQKWKFCVSGFGEENWRTRLDPDLSLMIDDLPEAATQLERGAVARLTFREASLQRTVILSPRNSKVVEVQCLSAHPSWTPRPSVTLQSLGELVIAMREVFRTYYEAVREHCPEVWESETFREWVKTPNVAACLPKESLSEESPAEETKPKSPGLWDKS